MGEKLMREEMLRLRCVKEKIKEERGLWITEWFIYLKGLFWIRWSW